MPLSEKEIKKLENLKEMKKAADQRVICIDLESRLIKLVEAEKDITQGERITCLLSAAAKMAVSSGVGKLKFEMGSKKVYTHYSSIWEKGKKK